MNVQGEINRIKGNVESAFTAVEEKGGTLPETQTSGTLPEAIRSIPEGPAYAAGDGLSKEGDTLSVTTPVRGIVTQAEFDALPQERRDKGLYVISDGGEGGGGPGASGGEVYSTEETRVGTWIDGKPLYRKCFTGLVSPSTSAQLDTFLNVSGLNIDSLPFLGGTIGRFPIPIANGTASAYLWITTDKTHMAIYVNGSSVVKKPVTLTLEYTKTTDEGGAS